MKIHEYQAKDLFKLYGIPVPSGEMIEIPDGAVHVTEEISKKVIVKAQIHAGGRGKGGGIKMANTPEEAVARAKEMIGMKLVTHQTGPEGRTVRRVLVEEALPIKKEYYLGIVVDRGTQQPVIMVSPSGGVDIEKVAAETPHLIFKEFVDEDRPVWSDVNRCGNVVTEHIFIIDYLHAASTEYI